MSGVNEIRPPYKCLILPHQFLPRYIIYLIVSFEHVAAATVERPNCSRAIKENSNRKTKIPKKSRVNFFFLNCIPSASAAQMETDAAAL